MNRDGLGLVGGAAADRPVVSAMVLAFGLTTLAVVGADEGMGAPAIRQTILDLVVGAGTILVAPLLISAFAPGRAAGRLALSLAIAALAATAILVQPTKWLAAPAEMAPSIAAGSALAVILIGAVPALGVLTRNAVLPVMAALLASIGALGFFAIEGRPDAPYVGAAAGLALAIGAATGFTALSDFVDEFARGSDRRIAAGRAAQEGVGPLLFAVAIAAAAFGLLGGEASGENLVGAGLTGASVLLTAATALVMSAAALSLKRTSEAVAVEENRRRQSFRAYWRPIRRALSPASANAAVAIAAIAVMAIAFNLTAPVSISLVLFIVVAGAIAGLIFFSLRAGLFVFFSLLVSVVVSKWFWREVGAPEVTASAEAAALALTAALYGQLALSWREARSPRLNARETAEAAMMRAFPIYAVSAVVGMTAFFALGAAGVWPRGATAAAEAGVLLTIGLVLGPALMTALSHAVRRELA